MWRIYVCIAFVVFAFLYALYRRLHLTLVNSDYVELKYVLLQGDFVHAELDNDDIERETVDSHPDNEVRDLDACIDNQLVRLWGCSGLGSARRVRAQAVCVSRSV